MANFNFQNNLKQAITPKAFMSDGLSLVAPIIYALPASLLKMDGWTGMLVSFFTTWFAGAAFGIPEFCNAAFTLVGGQLIYSSPGQKMFYQVTGKNIWSLEPAFVSTTGTESLTYTDVSATMGAGVYLGSNGRYYKKAADGTYSLASYFPKSRMNDNTTVPNGRSVMLSTGSQVNALPGDMNDYFVKSSMNDYFTNN